MKKIIFISLLLSLMVSITWAESLTKKLENFGAENGEAYISPWVTAFGTSLNTGLYQSAKVLKPFLFGVNVNSMALFVPDEDKTFTLTSPTIDGINIWENEELESATCFGDKGATVTFKDDISRFLDPNLPNGADMSIIPMFIPQVNMGLPFGNEIMVRGFPKVKIQKDVGDFSFWGVGLKHSLDQYIPLVPIDLAVQAAYQQMSFADVIDINSFAANIHISKKLLMWTLYGGVGYENTNMEVKYQGVSYDVDDNGDIIIVPTEVTFDIEGENEYRATAGLRYSFLLAKVYADYTLSKYNVLNIGLGLSF